MSNGDPRIKKENDSYATNPIFVNTLEMTADKHVRKEKPERSLKVCDESFDASKSEVEEKFQELIVREGNVFRCTMCERTMTHKGSMRRHLETHLTGLTYSCPLCDAGCVALAVVTASISPSLRMSMPAVVSRSVTSFLNFFFGILPCLRSSVD